MNNLHLPTVFRFNRIYNIWNNNNSEMCLSAIQHIQSYLRVSKGYITVLDLSKMVIMDKYLQDLMSVIGNCTVSKKTLDTLHAYVQPALVLVSVYGLYVHHLHISISVAIALKIKH